MTPFGREEGVWKIPLLREPNLVDVVGFSRLVAVRRATKRFPLLGQPNLRDSIGFPKVICVCSLPSSPLVAHLEERIRSAHGPDLAGVVDEAGVALGGPIKLPDGDGPEALEELLPHLRPQAVAHSQTHPVLLVVVTLRREEASQHPPRGVASPPGVNFRPHLGRVAEVAHQLAHVLDDGDVVAAAVVPELGGGELGTQDAGGSCGDVGG